MSVLGEVFGSLKVMTQVQLLLAFVACTSYAFAQGALVGPRGRRYAVGAGAIAAFGFAFESAQWTQAAILMAFAVAGMGLFVATVWVTSLSIGYARSSAGASSDETPFDTTAVPAPAVRALPHHAVEHAHSL